MGAQGGKDKTLTSKQIKFAEALALGDTKAGAYRQAYNTQAKPQVQSLEGQRLAASPAVSLQVEAFKLAIEAQRYATPAALRALVIERLTAAAINPEHKPAQQLRALELLGKVTEVAAFTERREIIKSDSPADAREKLLASLRAAISKSGGGASLLSELSRRPSVTIEADQDTGNGDGDSAAEPRPATADGTTGEPAPADGADGEPAPAGGENPENAPPPTPTPQTAAGPRPHVLT